MREVTGQRWQEVNRGEVEDEAWAKINRHDLETVVQQRGGGCRA